MEPSHPEPVQGQNNTDEQITLQTVTPVYIVEDTDAGLIRAPTPDNWEEQGQGELKM